MRYPLGYQVTELGSDLKSYVPKRDRWPQELLISAFLRVDIDTANRSDGNAVQIDLIDKKTLEGISVATYMEGGGWGRGGTLHPVEEVSFDGIETQIWRANPLLTYHVFFEHEDLIYDIHSDSLDFLKSILSTFRFTE